MRLEADSAPVRVVGFPGLAEPSFAAPWAPQPYNAGPDAPWRAGISNVPLAKGTTWGRRGLQTSRLAPNGPSRWNAEQSKICWESCQRSARSFSGSFSIGIAIFFLGAGYPGRTAQAQGDGPTRGLGMAGQVGKRHDDQPGNEIWDQQTLCSRQRRCPLSWIRRPPRP